MLNRNPRNYFADVEQMAFSPAHMVPGIEPSPDKMLQVSVNIRLLSPDLGYFMCGILFLPLSLVISCLFECM